MCLPILNDFGTPDQKARHLRKIISAEEIWCQMFSEPGAGSDVASLQTRAELDGDEWVINGQKVWTSGAQFCDYGLCLARTNVDVPKHEGISMFIVDMRAGRRYPSIAPDHRRRRFQRDLLHRRARYREAGSWAN